MALAVLDTQDVGSYWEGATHLHPLTSGSNPVDIRCPGGAAMEPETRILYYDRLDLVYNRALQDAFQSVVGFDPLYIDNSSAAASLSLNASGFDVWSVGQWDKVNNEQKIYTTLLDGSLNNPWEERSFTNFQVVDSDVWPNVGYTSSRSGSTTGDPGHYRQRAAGGGEFVFFEGYQGGVAYAAGTDVWDSGGTQHEYVMAVISLSTGLATQDAAFTLRYTNSPSEATHSGPFAGDQFDLWRMQFVPDGDNLLDAPKGLMVISSRGVTTGTPDEVLIYVAFYDFNPENRVGGAPSRVHGRLRLLTRLSAFEDTAFSTPGGIGVNVVGTDLPIVYHPPTQSIRLYTGGDLGGSTETSVQANRIGMNIYSSVPALNIVTKPTALAQPRTNARVDFSSTLLGDLGEPIGGQDVTFTLARVSTVDEDLGTSDGSLGATAGDFSLTNVPLDDIQDVRSVTAGPTGTETSYTPIPTGTASSGNEVEVNLTNGDLQFFVGGVATDLPNGDQVLATYNHFGVGASPSHGSLLTPSTRSDENGQVTAQVRYADDDDLEDEWDRLTVDTV